MRHARLAALVMMVAGAGCYSDAAPESTFPEPGPVPHQVSGPPGAATDPTFVAPYARPYDPPYGSPYAPPYAGDPRLQPPAASADGDAADRPDAAAPNSPDPDDDSDADDVAQAGPPDGPGAPPADLPPGVSGAPGPDADPGAPGVGPSVGSPVDPSVDRSSGIAQADPTGGVSDQEIDATLDGYGQWIDTDDYGQVWRPDATVVGVDFTPYESGGSWAYTDAGWAFACDYPWGWLPFHYGRWGWFHGYWGWVPGHRWGPAWVEWRHGGGVVGWRPQRPHPRGPGDGPGHRWHGGDAPFRDHRHSEQHSSHWRFATTTDFARPHIRSHLFGNPAEGLRVTTRVTAPPIRGTARLHAADLMRNRFAAGARAPQPGRAGTFHPSLGRTAGPAQTFQPPARSFQPRGPVQSVQSPQQSAQPPVYAPGRQPSQTYRPPIYRPGQAAQPGRPYYQPSPGQTAQPSRPYYQPPTRTFQPPQGYRPPVYQPGQPGQAGQPGRPYQPPVYHPPTFQPRPSPSPVAPSHTWTPPAHVSPPPPPVSHPSPPPPSAPSTSSAPAGHHRP